MNKTFATAINCMDGRAQLPVIEWIKEKQPVGFVDMITEPAQTRSCRKTMTRIFLNL